MKKICLKTVSDTLSNSEMKHVTGGNDGIISIKDPCVLSGKVLFNCSCNGAANPPFNPTWSACYDTEEMAKDIGRRCLYSGTCTAAK